MSEEKNIPEKELADDGPQQTELKNLQPETLEPDNSNLIPQIPEMEVHHHSHENHGKKNWKSYFWEFLMLFLAVFCGFLAEYQLEHKIEKDREKIYINSLIKDFEYDTLQFSLTIDKIKEKVPFYDSVLLFLKNPSAFSDKLPFRFYINTNLEKIYMPLEPTLQQLKNSGNLRLLRKKLVLDSIVIYDSKINGAYLNQTNYVVEFNKRLIQLQEKVFDDTNFNLFLNDVFNGNENNEDTVYDTPLFTKDKDKIMEMANLYIDAKATDVFYVSTLKSRKNDAKRLIALIKKEYHLE